MEHARAPGRHPGLFRSRRGHHIRQSAAAFLFLFGLGVALLRIGSLPSIHGVRLRAPWFLGDFRAAIYYPTQAFWHGVNPYNSSTYLARYPVSVPFTVYAPANFLVYLPAGFVSLPVASHAYFLLTLLLTMTLAALAVGLSGYRSAAAVLAASGAILLSRPGQWNLLLGQVTLPVVLGVYAAVLLARRAPAAAGVGIVFSLLKPTFGIPLIPLLLARGATRAVLWGLGLAVLVNLPPLLVLAHKEGGIGPFIATAWETQADFAASPANDPLKNVWRTDLPALVSHLAGAPIGTGASVLLAVVVLGLACWGLRRLNWGTDERNRLSLGIISCAVLLVVYHKAYDFLLLALPAFALVRAWKVESSPRSILRLEAGLLLVLAGNYLTSESVLAALPPAEFWGHALVSLNGVSLLCLFVVYLWQAQRYTTMRSEEPLSSDAPAQRQHLLPARS